MSHLVQHTLHQVHTNGYIQYYNERYVTSHLMQLRVYDIFMKLRDCEGKWYFSWKRDFRKIRMLLEEGFLPIEQGSRILLLSDFLTKFWLEKIKLRVLVDLIWHFYLFRSESIDVIGILGHKLKWNNHLIKLKKNFIFIWENNNL